MRVKAALHGLVAVTLVLLGVTTVVYLLEMRASYARIRSRSVMVPSPYGDIEFTQGGSGPPVLVIHGSGGGFDQGELIVDAVLGEDVHWITPSRFGYLRSTVHPGATFDDQAHAYAALLDHLGISRVAVVAVSHGGPSALLFAALHPERVTSLTLISAGVNTAAVADQAQANRQGDRLVSLYKSDALYWGMTTLFRRSFLKLMGVDDAVIASLTPSQMQLATRMITYMNPASPRAAGAAFDNAAALPGRRIAAVHAPTLIIHAKDDTLQLFHNAEYAAATIPGARLLAFETGGHLLVVTEQRAIRSAVRDHISRW